MLSEYVSAETISDVKNNTHYILTGPEQRDYHPYLVELAAKLLSIPEVGPIIDPTRPTVLTIVTTERANIVPLGWQVDIMAAYTSSIRDYSIGGSPSVHLVRTSIIEYSERLQDNVEYVTWQLDVKDVDDRMYGRQFQRIVNDTLNNHLPRIY